MHLRKEHREKYWNENDKQSYNCPDCGRGKDEVSEFHVHHLDENPRNGRLDNLLALCKECHYERHGHWTRRYTPAGVSERREQRIRRK